MSSLRAVALRAHKCSLRSDELRDAMLDEFPHHQTRRRPLDASDVEDAPGDSVKVVGIPRHDVNDQVSNAGKAVDLDDLGNVGERCRDCTELALLDGREDERLQWEAEVGRVDAALERTQRLFGGVTGKPGTDGVAGEAGRLSERDVRGVWILDHGPEKSRVDVVGGARCVHNDHSFGLTTHCRAHSAQTIYRHLRRIDDGVQIGDQYTLAPYSGPRSNGLFHKSGRTSLRATYRHRPETVLAISAEGIP